MARESIEQALCTDCEDDEAVTHVKESDMDGSTITHDVYCSCGNSGTITVDTAGTHTDGTFTHENASWNTEQRDDDTDE